jgi:hypothetical protein
MFIIVDFESTRFTYIQKEQIILNYLKYMNYILSPLAPLFLYKYLKIRFFYFHKTHSISIAVIIRQIIFTSKTLRFSLEENKFHTNLQLQKSYF